MPASITIKCINGATRFIKPVTAPSAFDVNGCWVDTRGVAALVQCTLSFNGGAWTEGYQPVNNNGTFTYSFQNVPIPPKGVTNADLTATLVAQQGGPAEAVDGPIPMTLSAAAPQTPCPAPTCP
jgi:hypothetical protein